MDVNLGNFIPTEAESEGHFKKFRSDARLRAMFDELVQAHVAWACGDKVDTDEIRQMDVDDMSMRIAGNMIEQERVVDTYLYELSELMWWRLSHEPREDEREPEDFWDELMKAPHEFGWVHHYMELVDRIAEELQAIADNAKNGGRVDFRQAGRQIISRLREDQQPDTNYCTADGFLFTMIDFIVSTYHWWEEA